MLLAADATDPTAVEQRVRRGGRRGTGLLARDLPARLLPAQPFEWRVHRRYNPESITAYNIVPGLIGTLLTFTPWSSRHWQSPASASAGRWRTSSRCRYVRSR